MAHKEENTTGAPAPVINDHAAEAERKRLAEDELQKMGEAEFQRWAGIHRLDVDVDDMEADDLATFKKVKKRIVNGIKESAITIDEKGWLTVKLCRHPKIESMTFYEREGSHLQGIDRHGKGQEGHKAISMMAQITKTHSSTWANLVGYELKLCEGIFSLLMD